jgi:hypothetical protein
MNLDNLKGPPRKHTEHRKNSVATLIKCAKTISALAADVSEPILQTSIDTCVGKINPKDYLQTYILK